MSAVAHLRHARTFDSLRKHHNYRLYFAGQIVSITGTWVQSVAQAWLIIELTHSPVAVGFLALCQFGPFALFGLLGGVVSDRLDNRRTLMATQSASMVFAGALAVLTLSHVVQEWEVFALAAANGMSLVFDTPARQAFTIQMVGRDELPNAIALNSSIFNASRVMGPGLGGLIIAGAGVGVCFAVNGASYLAVLAGLLLMDESRLHRVRRAEQRPTLFRGLVEGLAYARHTPVVRLVILLMLVVATISINFNVVLPILASRTLNAGPAVFGLISACFGGGALVGALLSASLARADMRVLLVAAGGFGIAELVLAPVHGVAVACVLLVFAGSCFSLYTSNSNSAVQLSTPDHLRGRVLSLYSYVFFGTAPLGGLLAGWLSARGGTELAFIVAGATALLMTLLGVVWSRRWLDRNAGQPDTWSTVAAASHQQHA
ncbi:MAG: MFS transporter [Chloroflexi bacterium]|nr:MAG: MFS transporter [Chloroflexota bacterium]